MRCDCCAYGGKVYEYNSIEEYAEVCGLIEEKEITFNEKGCGCILNGKTIQKRFNDYKKERCKCIE